MTRDDFRKKQEALSRLAAEKRARDDLAAERTATGGGEPTATDAEVLAHAAGYAKALDDCDRADIAALIKERDVLRVDLAFERARRSTAERQRDDAQAHAATLSERVRELLSAPAAPREREPDLSAVARAICRVQLNGGDPDQAAVRWNGTEMEPQDFPAWWDFRDEASAALVALAPEPTKP